MTERLQAFQKGVEIKWTCWLGYRGRIKLLGMEEMKPEDLRRYIATCQAACRHCAFASRSFCNRIGKRGVAEADSHNDYLEDSLRRYKTPCSQNKIIVER